MTGSVYLTRNTASSAPTVAGNIVIGALVGVDNQPPPTYHGPPHTTTAGAFGQCAHGG
ncbi:MAG TPA: hypothetical protein VKZ67_00915 [Natronosporangium sp.]|nr:hypothetical protein [Natronosporangium sp.]